MYRKYLYTGWLCLLMFAASQMGHAALKIYYVRVGDALLGEHALADGYQWRKQGIVP